MCVCVKQKEIVCGLWKYYVNDHGKDTIILIENKITLQFKLCDSIRGKN